MCKYLYRKINSRTNKEMYYCLLKIDESDELSKLCTWQRYCNKDKAYILNDINKCTLNK